MKGFFLASLIFLAIIFPVHASAFFSMLVFGVYNMTFGLFI